MKKIVFLLTFLFVILTVTAATERITLNKGESLFLNQKNITLLNADFKNDNVLICVNNQKAIVSDEEMVNGARIEIKDVIDEGTAELEIEVESCNDDSCKCTIDCTNNLCITTSSEPPEDECYTDSDCDDNNDQTEDKCEGTPKTCTNTLIQPSTDCANDEDCNDNDECTADRCINNECVHPKVECGSDNQQDNNTSSPQKINFKMPGFRTIMTIITIVLVVLIIVLGLVLKYKKPKA